MKASLISFALALAVALPTVQSDICMIPEISHGEIKKVRPGTWYWTQKISTKIPAGVVFPDGFTATLFCHRHYFVQGKFRSIPITCSKGQWQPDPLCRLSNKVTSEKTYETVTRTTEKTQTSMTIAPEIILESVKETRTNEKSQASQVKSPETECCCEYPINNEILIAHADKKRLKFNDKVQNGSVVIFRCKHVGFYYLDGVKSVKCENCRSWHSSELPTCSEPKQGGAVIIFDNSLNVSVEGNLEAKIGQDIKLMCVAVESNLYPHWSFPSDNGIILKREQRERKLYRDVLYISHLAIKNADVKSEGLYGCAVGNNPMNTINLVIKAPSCVMGDIFSALPENVVPDMDNRNKTVPYNTTIKLICAKDMVEQCQPVARCNGKGQWDVENIQCISGCPELATYPELQVR